MKINPNILAAAILGASIIIATIIYANIPQTGRYTYKFKNESGALEESVFDSATGTRYEYSLLTFVSPAHSSYKVTTVNDYKTWAKKQSESAK